jgi:signal transduction histidine kinase
MDTAVAFERLRLDGDRSTLGLECALFATVALTATAATLAAGAHTDQPAWNALVRGTMVAGPMVAGLYAAHVRGHERFGALLYVTGVVAFLTTLSETRNDGLYTAGRIAGWGMEILIAVLLLAYPSGRLATRRDRRLVAALSGSVAVFYLPTLFLSDTFRVPSPWTSCRHSCPTSALFALDDAPGWVEPLLRVPGSLSIFIIMIAVVARLQERMRDATPVARLVLTPVLILGMARASLLGLGVVGREFGGRTPVIETTAWLLALSVPAIALACFAGLLRGRLFTEQALRRLARVAQEMPDAGTLRRALAGAFGEPHTQILFPANEWENRWLDAGGAEVKLPRLDPARTVHLVTDQDRTVAAIVYDTASAPPPELVDAAANIAAVALDNQRLAAHAEAADRELVGSRARIAASADAERRRIERDLHDGAQQRLVALRIELGLLQEIAARDPARVPERLHELEQSAEDALTELRALAHGVCPPLLADRRLADALTAVVARCPLPVRLETHDLGSYAPEVETAVYFCILEALQNVQKHAPEARRTLVQIDGRGPGELRFLVHDDGPGTTPDRLEGGAGLTNMRDRIAAIGGQLSVASSPGLGTTVRGRVPAPRGDLGTLRTAAV